MPHPQSVFVNYFIFALLKALNSYQKAGEQHRHLVSSYQDSIDVQEAQNLQSSHFLFLYTCF